MTAIGFIVTVIGFGGSLIFDGSYSHLARTVRVFCEFLIVVGCMAMLAGVTIKIWELMP